MPVVSAIICIYLDDLWRPKVKEQDIKLWSDPSHQFHPFTHHAEGWKNHLFFGVTFIFQQMVGNFVPSD
jgi:hypothetical protein